jgi:hypothetical protein
MTALAKYGGADGCQRGSHQILTRVGCTLMTSG